MYYHWFEINYLDRANRFCEICDMKAIGDEYHYIFECENIYIATVRNVHVSDRRHTIVCLNILT